VGLVKNYESLLALRFCLGIFEAGLFPGLNFFLTGWYRRVSRRYTDYENKIDRLGRDQ
jgi:MFS family permease